MEQTLIQGGDAPVPLSLSARRLGLSRRTLIRRLHEAGTSYREVSDLHRRRRAEVLLRDGSQSVAEIAYRLGYKDAASFARGAGAGSALPRASSASTSVSGLRVELDAQRPGAPPLQLMMPSESRGSRGVTHRSASYL